MRILPIMLLPLLFATACSQKEDGVIEWTTTEHPAVIRTFGEPQLVSTCQGEAVHFDGIDDGLYMEGVPMSNMKEVTVEMLFRQEPSDHFEQRFMHAGEYKGNRVMFESRVKPDSTWYFDAYVHQGDPSHNVVLIDPDLTHPTGKWYNLALVASDEGMTTYVNGIQQCHSDVPWLGVVNEGLTSIGVRQNLVCWFNGDICWLRVTPRALQPSELHLPVQN